jgi:DNA-binding NarL/FixJ family response regulator
MGEIILTSIDKIKINSLSPYAILITSNAKIEFINKEDKIQILNIDILSDRELEVYRLIADCKSNDQIAKDLYISKATAKNHVCRILKKLNIKNRNEIIKYESKING